MRRARAGDAANSPVVQAARGAISDQPPDDPGTTAAQLVFAGVLVILIIIGAVLAIAF